MVQHGSPTCIVLIPSLSRGGWLAAIEAAAADQGFDIAIDGRSGSLDELQSGSSVLITRYPAEAKSLGSSRCVVIMDGQRTTADAMAQELDLAQGDAVIAASGLLAEITQLATSSLVITTAGTQPGESVTLWNGFAVTAPEAAPHAEPDPVAAAAREALAIYDAGPPKVGMRTRWDQALFTYDQSRIALRSKISEIDITGPARVFVFGPYLSLPAGLWRSHVRFMVDGDAASHRFRAEWGNRTHYTSESFVPGRPGLFEISLDYLWQGVEQAELRLIMAEGSLNGTFEFLGMELERVV